MKLILLYLTPVVSIICAATLAVYEKSGWGWFLLVACLAYPNSRETKDTES